MKIKVPTLSNFWQLSLHKQIVVIALPMILSNITTPLMGLVDTAVLGHMQGSYFLAGASVATLLITQIYWVCGFLRMTSTGLSAQAKGSAKVSKINQSLFQSLLIGLVLGCGLLALQDVILTIGLRFSETTELVKQAMIDYFKARIWGAPAAMLNLALIGWMIGQQQTKQVLAIQVIGNLINVALSICFVFVFEWGVQGVALATVVSEYTITAVSTWMAVKGLAHIQFSKKWLTFSQLKPLLNLNGNTFFRNLALQACIGFLIFKGVGFSPTNAAINAILMQFFTLIALGLDGVAFAAEALVGEQKGRLSSVGIKQVTLHGLIWSCLLAVVYSLVFVGFGEEIVGLLTDQVELQVAIRDYHWFIYSLPIIAHWCFYFDGVFVGLTRAVAMRNSMLFCALAVYFPAFYIFANLENQGLWIAMSCFLMARGVSLGGYFMYLCGHHFQIEKQA
ncbi:MATE family efflux transporter [Paraglaciecola sp. 2405UD69-4]|uniref:MATE family efflux transporter n=1 Tax=Paraglaciecola sp. 2405UD69-4 TaxID=3391836 RepID=UPI0039C9986A